MNKNDITGIVGCAVIAIAFGICAAVILPITAFFGWVLIGLTAFFALGTIVSLVGALKKETPQEEPEEVVEEHKELDH